jgi:CRP-like cAMP-binding protein
VVEQPGAVVGTLAYMPPEQALGRIDIDVRVDVFALGGILYRILSQRPPHQGGRSMEMLGKSVAGEILPPRAVVAANVRVPAELERICMRAMASSIEERYTSVEDLANDVDSFLRGGSWLSLRSYAAGSVVVREGEPGDEAYIITKGTCEVSKIEKGRSIALRVMGPGTVFGETAVLTGQPRTATVTALDDLTVLVASREALDHEICFDSWTGSFVRALAERFRDLDSQMTGTRLIRADGRVYGWLREFVVAAGTATADGRFEAPIGRVCDAIRAEYGLADAELIALLQRSSDITVDETRGVISVRSPGATAAVRGG